MLITYFNNRWWLTYRANYIPLLTKRGKKPKAKFATCSRVYNKNGLQISETNYLKPIRYTFEDADELPESEAQS